MDYYKIYYDLINRAKQTSRIRGQGIYYEGHHIIPRCIGGTDDLSNIVQLTAKEHFVAHHLLTKIYPKNNKIYYAFMAMFRHSSNQQRYIAPAITYEIAKRRHAAIQSRRFKQNNPGPVRKGKDNPMYGSARFGELNPFYGKSHNKESISKMKVARQKYFEENDNRTKESIWINDGVNMRRHPKNNPMPEGWTKGQVRITCQHCGETVGAARFKRSHGDKCSSKGNFNLTMFIDN